jgi:hypothetical protein
MINHIDRLRTPEEALAPDEIQKYFSVVNLRTGESRPKTFEDHYAKISRITLHDGVPDNIQIHFEVSKNLLLYSWFVWRFISVSEMHVYASAEYALRERIGSAAGEKATLRPLLEYAVKHRLIDDNAFSHYVQLRRQSIEIDQVLHEVGGGDSMKSEPIDQQQYSRILVETIPQLRNIYAHGTNSLMPDTFLTFRICCDLINQIFRDNQPMT